MTIKENNKVCLCESCTYNYPDCPAEIDSVEFGDDVGCDNICCCNKYEPILKNDYYRGGFY